MATIEDLLDGPPVTEDINEAFYVNPITRTIEIPDTELILGAMRDDRGECKFFRIPKVVGNSVQVSACSLRVYYTNANGESHYFPVTNVVDQDDCIVFCWEITKNVTVRDGRVSFSICVCRTENGTVQKAWNTTDAYGTVLPNIPDASYEDLRPAPDVVYAVEQLVRQADDAAKEAKEAASNAEKGDPGPPGEKGEKGDPGENGNPGVWLGSEAPAGNGYKVWIDPTDEDSDDVVLYSAQTLTNEQKAQARANIGAATVAEVIDALPVYNGEVEIV